MGPRDAQASYGDLPGARSALGSPSVQIRVSLQPH